jgi:hypothetical protein
MEGLWKRIFICCWFTHWARNAWVEKNKVFFHFLEILRDERFIFVSLSFRRVEIDFDIGFIMRPTNFSLIYTTFLIILYTNIKNCDFLFCISLKYDRGIGHVDSLKLDNIHFYNIKFSHGTSRLLVSYSNVDAFLFGSCWTYGP